MILLLIDLAEKQDQSGWFRGVTRLEKIIFLLHEEYDAGKWLTTDKPKFIPYKLGPYSRDVYEALDFLSSYNLIDDQFTGGASNIDRSIIDSMEELMTTYSSTIPYEERRFKLAPDGKRAVNSLKTMSNSSALQSIDECFAKYGGMPLGRLLRYVYQKYPNYTGQSIIKGEVLGS
ncbi:MAG: hypothetical protein OXI70_14205 [Chloroflexota bacterium]|nr:hypothetical protein [Chloroflexota bacterium]